MVGVYWPKVTCVGVCGLKDASVGSMIFKGVGASTGSSMVTCFFLLDTMGMVSYLKDFFLFIPLEELILWDGIGPF